MGAVWECGRRELRARRASTILLVVLVWVAGGVVLASAAGARRTDTAMARFVEAFRPSDGELSALTDADVDTIGRRDEVVAVGRQSYVLLLPRLDAAAVGTINFFVAGDEATFRDVDRLHVARGRMFDYRRGDEIVIDEQTEQLSGVGLGEFLTVQAFTAEQNEEIFTSAFGHGPEPRGPSARLRVVGVVRRPQDLALGFVADEHIALGDAYAYLPPAFLHTPAGQLSSFASEGIAQLRLRRGTSAEGFARVVSRLLPEAAFDAVAQDRLAAATAQRAIRIEALALLIFGVLGAVAATLIVGQTLARQVQLEASTHDALRALGLTRVQRVGVAMVRASVVAVVGAAGAVAVAIALSPLTPLGLARLAEIHRGVEVNLAILGAGSAALVAGILIRAAVPAWRATRGLERVEDAGGRLRVVERLAGAGLPLPAVAGLQLAGERGRRTAPQRTTVAGIIASVAGIVAALCFLTSLDSLAGDPLRQGWNWDVLVGNPNAQTNAGDAYVEALADDPTVSAGATVSETTLRIEDRFVPVLGWRKVKGDVSPVVLDGRMPAGPLEVALASETMRVLRSRIGGEVAVTGSDTARISHRVVGRILMPGAAQADFNVDFALGRGAVMTQDAIDRVLGGEAPPRRLAAVEFAPGVDSDSGVRHLRSRFGRVLFTERRDLDLESLLRVRQLPLLLALLLAVIGIGSLAHMLVASVRRCQRDLAVFKTVGFLRRQVAAAVACHATAVALTGILVGVPLGAALGRSAWALVVREAVGTEPAPVVPAAPVFVVAVGALLVANVLAAWPGWAAARIRPAMALRVE